uniref:Uncharacterized protein n=1 Tax=Ditylenchus dipsaci TaxID=166011 RepID=A0A915DRL6_9BILA
MQVSTAASQKEKGVIFMCCGPSDNKALIKQYGKTIGEKIEPFLNSEWITYKSDARQPNLVRQMVSKYSYSLMIPTRNDKQW